jgi:hypothetical protein
MHIDLITHANTHKSNLVYTDFFINQNFNLILMTHHLEQSEFLDSLNSIIINELIDAKLDEVPKDKLKQKIKDFFITINWQLYSKFETADTKEHGLSLLLFISIDNKAYIVQFGRLLCGLMNQNLKVIGKEWRHFSVKNTDELFLLGSRGENIAVSVLEAEFEKNSHFVAIPSDIAEELIVFENRPKKILSQIQFRAQKEQFPYFILKTKPSLLIPKKKFEKRYRIRITAAILFMIIILSTLYVFYGKNWLADQQNLLRIKNQEFMRNELLERVIEAQEVMNQTLQEVYQLEIFPNQKLEFHEIASIEYENAITSQVYFDMHSLYWISNNKVVSVRKKIGSLKWEKKFEHSIQEIMLIDANRVLALTADKKMYCLNRETGYLIWQQECEHDFLLPTSNKKLFQISINRFKQLDSSLILIPGKQKITLVNNLNGEIISDYQFENEIQFISDFDLIDRSLFVVEKNHVKQIRLEIKY